MCLQPTNGLSSESDRLRLNVPITRSASIPVPICNGCGTSSDSVLLVPSTSVDKTGRKYGRFTVDTFIRQDLSLKFARLILRTLSAFSTHHIRISVSTTLKWTLNYACSQISTYQHIKCFNTGVTTVERNTFFFFKLFSVCLTKSNWVYLLLRRTISHLKFMCKYCVFTRVSREQWSWKHSSSWCLLGHWELQRAERTLGCCCGWANPQPILSGSPWGRIYLCLRHQQRE